MLRYLQEPSFFFFHLKVIKQKWRADIKFDETGKSSQCERQVCDAIKSSATTSTYTIYMLCFVLKVVSVAESYLHS